ncbi:conserved hypothetical protein [Gammaproteobacteria bacterium]
MGVFSSMSYARLSRVAKSSTIPDKREYPANSAINPCVNFYEYACSPVIASFQLREDRSSHVFSFSDADERLLEFKKKYFLSLAKKAPESEIEKEIKNYYLACMNKQAGQKEEKAFVKQTKEMLAKITTREEFAAMIAKNITNSSQLSFVGFFTDSNLDRPTYNDLFFYVSLMSLPERSYYKNKKLTEELRALMKQFFVTIDEKAPTRKAELVFNFGKELAQEYPTPPQVQERYFSRTEFARKDLIKNYPHLKLEKFLSDIPAHVVIRNIIGNNTMEFLNKKLETASLEELKSIYLYFQLKSIMDDAYPKFFNKKFEFNKKYLGGPNKRPDRHERCTQSVISNFEKEVDFTLLPKVFPGFPKEKFIKSIEKIRASLIDQLNDNKWLSSGAKKEAIRKIKKAKLALVSPDNEADWDFHPMATYSIDSPIANSHKLGGLMIDKQLKELNGPVNVNRWQMGPLTVSASYSPFYNRFEFPVGILQYPFYDPNEPEEVNLGAIGAVIGHELGHAIDDHGSGFNADGVLKPWMSDADKKVFNERSQYLIMQFNKIGHNGKFTLGENIGDLVGVSTAYRAAFPLGSGSKELKKRFFLQWARTWCKVERKGVTELRLKTDPHALEYARTNEQMKQQPGFKEAYSCKPNDPMVLPENEIVKIW